MTTLNELILKVRQIDELETLADGNHRFYVEHDHTQALSAEVNSVIRKALKDEAKRLREAFFCGLNCCADCVYYNLPDYCTNCRVNTGGGSCLFVAEKKNK